VDSIGEAGRMILGRSVMMIAIAMAIAPCAAAQNKETLPIVAADARVAFPRYKDPATVATGLQVNSLNLPTRGFGLIVGAHLYPLHKGIVTFGFGGELIASRGSKTLEAESASVPPSPTVRTEFSSIAPQVSINFGKREGWSYLSVGLGSARLTTEREDRPETVSAPRVKALNYGGGARWFAKKHLALSLDLRFYQVNAQAPVGTRPAYPKVTMVVASAGVAFK
jgi:hypothetical protein